jgi:hypothetical protein
MVEERQSGIGEFRQAQETYKRAWLQASIKWPNRQFDSVVWHAESDNPRLAKFLCCI